MQTKLISHHVFHGGSASMLAESGSHSEMDRLGETKNGEAECLVREAGRAGIRDT